MASSSHLPVYQLMTWFGRNKSGMISSKYPIKTIATEFSMIHCEVISLVIISTIELAAINAGRIVYLSKKFSHR